MDLKTILEEFLKHRREVVRRRTEYELRLARERAHILEGFKKAPTILMKLLPHLFVDQKRKKLPKKILLPDLVTEAKYRCRLAMRLQTLADSNEKIEPRTRETCSYSRMEAILADPDEFASILEEESCDLRKIYDDRRTVVIPTPLEKMVAIDTI